MENTQRTGSDELEENNTVGNSDGSSNRRKEKIYNLYMIYLESYKNEWY